MDTILTNVLHILGNLQQDFNKWDDKIKYNEQDNLYDVYSLLYYILINYIMK